MKTVKVQSGKARPHWIRPSVSIETGADRYRLGHRSVSVKGKEGVRSPRAGGRGGQIFSLSRGLMYSQAVVRN